MFFKNYLIFFIFFGVLGCSTTEQIFEDITEPDYVNSSKAKRLEIPPDLSEIESSNTYSVPGEAKSYKDYLEREEQYLSESQNQSQKKVITNPEGMKIVKSGNLRWLVVDKDPDSIWPFVKEFWEDLGFRVLIANKRTGIIETEWMSTDDIKLDKQEKGVLSTFDKWLDSLSGFADRRKFRTRVEFGEQGTTEIYISQRSAEAATDQHSRILSERNADYNPSRINKIEEYKSDDKSNTKKVEVSEQREIDDYEIDSELLTRLMIKLGALEKIAEDKVKNPVNIIKAELFASKDDMYIKMFDPFDRAWRRLGLALDIIGFVTEDKNRSDGIYYVRYSQLELPNESKEEEEGLIDSLIFWDDDKQDIDRDHENKNIESGNVEENINEDEILFTGIEAPQVKPIDEDYVPEEHKNNTDYKSDEEETWISNIWPSWGDEKESSYLPENEQRYRIRIKPIDDQSSIVYLDYPNTKKNISNDAKKVLTIINEYLK